MSALRDAIPTEQFLLPGQQLSVNVPWERDDRPPPPFIRPVIAARGNTLDAPGKLEADVISGVYLGACQVIRRLTPGSADQLLGLRETEGEGLVPVVLRRLELPDAYDREVRAYADWAMGIAHPNLARVFPCEETDEGLFWVTALVSGATLAEISDACVKAGKSVPVGLALASVYEAALGLCGVHAPPSEAHGLLCDQSLVVGFDGQARLLDVGLFRALRQQSLWPSVIDRIAPYLSPEQVLRGHLPDPRSDVFALAALLHAFLSGGRTPAPMSFDQRASQHRHGGYPPPSSLNVALSTKVDEVVMKALSENPRDRYANAVEFALALKCAASELFWRKELRAQFVGQLFSERKRREEVLFAATSDQPKEDVMAHHAAKPCVTRDDPAWTRPPPIPPKQVKTSLKKKRQYLLGSPTPDMPTRQERAIAEDSGMEFAASGDFDVVFEDDGEEYDERGRPRQSLRPLVMTLVAVMLTWFWQQGVLLDDVPTWAPLQAAKVERLVRAQLFQIPFVAPRPFFTAPMKGLTADGRRLTAAVVPAPLAVAPVVPLPVVEPLPEFEVTPLKLTRPGAIAAENASASVAHKAIAKATKATKEKKKRGEPREVRARRARR